MQYLCKDLWYLLINYVGFPWSLVCLSVNANAQLASKGTIHLIKRVDSVVVFSYSPPSLLLLPVSMNEAIVYKSGGGYHYRISPLEKNGYIYRFSVLLPAEVNAVVVAVKDRNGNLLDNNNETGYSPLVFDVEKPISLKTYEENVELLSYYAQLVLKLNYKSVEKEILKLYEKGFGEYPEWKNVDVDHQFYLRLLYNKDQDSVQPILNLLADSLSLTKDSERNWQKALFIYKLIGDKEKYQRLKTKAINKFPRGRISQEFFLTGIYTNPDSTEQDVLQKLTFYLKTFPDTSAEKKYPFYDKILNIHLHNLDSNKLTKYESLINKPAVVASIYNNFANALLESATGNANSKFYFAKFISLRTISMIANLIQHIPPNQNDGILYKSYQKGLHIYTKLLLLENRTDSAFYYAEKMAAISGTLSEEMYGTYVTAVEKCKGNLFAFNFLLENMMREEYAQVNLQHLKRLSGELGRGEKEVDSLKVLAAEKNLIKRRNEVIAQLGNIQMRQFVLHNLNGDKVSTKELEGKTIVLKFWATWCGPCKAEIPSIKRAIDTYQGDSSVIILLIDCYEFDTPDNVLKNAREIIGDHKYHSNVLIDSQNKVASLYQVDKIPQQIVINPKGEVVSVGHAADLSSLIRLTK